MYVLLCSEARSSPWTEKKNCTYSFTPSYPIFPPFYALPPPHPQSCTLSDLRYAVSATFWQELQDQLALSLLSTKQPFFKKIKDQELDPECSNIKEEEGTYPDGSHES